MSTKPAPGAHLTQYERAVCYYTLPRVTRPLTYGIIVAYGVCLAEALGATLIGVLSGGRTWTLAGTVSLVALVVFGMVIFTLRTFLNELRQRRALADARAVPDVVDSDLPDPFAQHLLLSHPRDEAGRVFSCCTQPPSARYRVRRVESRRPRMWEIDLPEGGAPCVVRQLGAPPSFSFGGSSCGNLLVSREGVELARVTSRGFSLSGDRTDVRVFDPTDARYRIEHRCIYHADRLVGRIYFLRRALYLDIEADHFNPGILAYYAIAL